MLDLPAPPSAIGSHKKVDMQWIGEVFARANVSIDIEFLQLYESILLRNKIYSKEDLALFTKEDFMIEVVSNHEAELKPSILRLKFESLLML